MNHGKVVRYAIIIGLILAVIAVFVAIGAPMIEMLRTHLGG